MKPENCDHGLEFALRLAFAVAAVGGLSACEGMKEQLGMGKKSPDEFAVVTKAPLVQPPDYHLRPPQPGAARPQEATPRTQAQEALVRQRVGAQGQDAQNAANLAAGRSPGEIAILNRARAASADPAIRRVVNEEFTQLAERDKGFVDKLIFWQTQPPLGTALDPAKEAQRLREAQAAGKSTVEGDTPTIQRRKRGILEGIF